MIKGKVERRQFLRGAMAAAGTTAMLPALQGLGLLTAHGRAHAAPGLGGYGALAPTPDLRDGVMRIALPNGFQYRSFSHSGASMSDGNRVPIALDGMGLMKSRSSSRVNGFTTSVVVPAPPHSSYAVAASNRRRPVAGSVAVFVVAHETELPVRGSA